MRLFSKSGLKQLGGLLSVFLALKYGVGALGVVNSLALVYLGIGTYGGLKYAWQNRHGIESVSEVAGYVAAVVVLLLLWLPAGAYFAADYLGGWGDIDE